MADPIRPYGPTAARAHGRPGREARPAGITIDMHAHLLVPEAAELVRPHLDATAAPAQRFATAETRAVNRRQAEERYPNLTDMDVRLRDMEAMGVDMQVVMPAPPQCYYAVPAELGMRAARMINDGIAAFVARRPDRFAALGTVPLQDGAAAAAELERVMRELGFRGAQVLTNVAGHELSDAAYAPFWAAAERLGAVVAIHPGGFTDAARLSRFYFNNVIGNPLETTIALHYLIFDGVLERHPSLKLVAVHGGGYAAAYSGRMDHAWGAREDCHALLPNPPSSYLKRIFVDSVVFTPHQLANLIRVFGADHVLMGTDYPYDMGEYDPIGHLAAVEGLAPAALAKIAGENAARLYGIG